MKAKNNNTKIQIKTQSQNIKDIAKRNFILINNILTPAIILVNIIAASYLYKNTYSQIIRNAFVAIIGYFLYNYSLNKKEFVDYKINFGNIITIIIGFTLSTIFPIVPLGLWLFTAIGVILTLYTNKLSAAILYATMIAETCLLSIDNAGIFIFYFFATFASSLIIDDKNLKANKVVSYVLSAVLQLINLLLIHLFYVADANKFEIYIYPICNILISLIIIIFVDYCLISASERKTSQKYSQITDWSFPILQEMKNNKPISYMRTVHISHYAGQLCRLLDCDENLTKAGASYSCILSLFENDQNRFNEIMEDLDFPDALNDLLTEINSENLEFTSNEAFIVSISKTLVFAILKLKNSNKDYINVYDKIVQTVLAAYYNSSRLKKLNISFAQFEAIKTCLIDEKKYLKILNM